jgi:hypothetical protein
MTRPPSIPQPPAALLPVATCDMRHRQFCGKGAGELIRGAVAVSANCFLYRRIEKKHTFATDMLRHNHQIYDVYTGTNP